MGLLESLGRLVDWVVNFLPRPLIVRSTHGAVKYRWGRPVAIRPGSYTWYWPLFTEVEQYPITIQTLTVHSQGLLDSEGNTFAVKVKVRYSVHDHLLALTTLQDIDEFVADMSACAVAVGFGDAKSEHLKGHFPGMSEGVKDSLDGELESYGIRIHQVGVTDIAYPTVHKILDPGFLFDVTNRGEE